VNDGSNDLFILEHEYNKSCVTRQHTNPDDEIHKNSPAGVFSRGENLRSLVFAAKWQKPVNTNFMLQMEI